MPQRKVTEHVTITTEAVQGEDSYLKVKRFTMAESKEFEQLIKNGALEQRSAAWLKFAAAHVLEWNWVDDDGEPFPQPQDDPAVLGKLTMAEMSVIEDVISGLKAPDPGTLKN